MGQSAAGDAELSIVSGQSLAVHSVVVVHCARKLLPACHGSRGVAGMKQHRFRIILVVISLLGAITAFAQSGSELRFCLHSEPKTFNPLLAEDDSSETIRYLTGGVLIRVDRLTQNAIPELATAWKISNGGRTIIFKLRDGVRFSDNTPFSAEDVGYTVRQLMDPALHSPTADSFRSGEGAVEIQVLSRNRVAITFPAPIAGFDKLLSQDSSMAHDVGVSLDSEQMWFNQVASSPLPDYKKEWFRSTNFRRAISEAINRDDLARIVFHGHAGPAVGPVSVANKFWFNSKLQPHPFDPTSALQRLSQDVFQLVDGVLRDRQGHGVEFSLITNSGNKYRERMATMIQQDLAGIGIKLNIVTLDFPSLIERITRRFNYEACLLGLVNNDLDPDSQMNIWLSSAENHQWNPNQKSPATNWEAEIDKLMRAQASTLDSRKRKTYFDQVQEIAWEQEPFIYLVNRNALSAVSPSVHNAHPVVLRPQVYWNIDQLVLGNEVARKH